MASQIAIMLQGKDKPTYHPSQLNGDVVVVVNAKYVELTGKRWKQHSHEWYTGAHHVVGSKGSIKSKNRK